MKKYVLLLLILSSLEVFAQNTYYLISLKDKNNNGFSIAKPDAFLSKRAIDRRQKQGIAVTTQDLPLTPAYLTQIQGAGATIWLKSKWFNAVVIQCNTTTLNKVKALSCVANSSAITRKENTSLSDNLNAIESTNNVQELDAVSINGYSKQQLSMTENDKMHTNGFTGKGLHIAVLDAGYLNADKNPALDSLRKKKNILGTVDFVNKNHAAVYKENDHGANCLTILAANSPYKLKGAAPDASYWLIRTENELLESRLEEINWTCAAEFADSVGVDIISSSLGYYDFDNKALSYTYSQMNGKTTYISRAATYAQKKGIVVVCSAGNEAQLPWKYISSPADADSILAIGAVDSLGNRGSFSSLGPSSDNRIKPDVCTRGVKTWYADPNLNTLGKPNSGNGTSYSCPLIAGWVACFWQAFPNLTANQIVAIVKKAGSIANKPNNNIGYGIPNYTRASLLANSVLTGFDDISEIKSGIYPNPTQGKLNIVHPIFSNLSSIEIINSQGEIYQQVINNELDLDGFTNGMYLLKLIFNNGECHFERFIKN